MRLLWFNLATDEDDPLLGFAPSWIRAMARRVESIYVVTTRSGRIAMPNSVKVYTLGKEKGYSRPHRAALLYGRLFSILSHVDIDACFSHMNTTFSVLAAPVLKVRRIPLISWYAHPSLTIKVRLAHHLSDRVVTSLKMAYPYRQDKLSVIGQGIDTELFSQGATPPEEPPMILCVGRLSPVKDHHTLIKAVAIMRQRLAKPFRVLILGSPASKQDESYERSLYEIVLNLRLEEIVQFHPSVPRVQLPDSYRRAVLHVNLSRTGFGDKVALEAMSCARPSLTANQGLADTLGKYSRNLMFDYGDARELSNRLCWLISLPPEERWEIGSYLREQIVQMHSLDRLTTKLLQVISQTLVRGKAHAPRP